MYPLLVLLLLRVLTIDETTETKYFSCNTIVSFGTAPTHATVLVLRGYKWVLKKVTVAYQHMWASVLGAHMQEARCTNHWYWYWKLMILLKRNAFLPTKVSICLSLGTAGSHASLHMSRCSQITQPRLVQMNQLLLLEHFELTSTM